MANGVIKTNNDFIIFKSVSNGSVLLNEYTLSDTDKHTVSITPTSTGIIFIELTTGGDSGLKVFIRLSPYTNVYELLPYYSEPVIKLPVIKNTTYSMIYQKISGTGTSKLTVRHFSTS